MTSIFNEEIQREFKIELRQEVLKVISDFKKQEPRLLGLMTRKQIKDELDISTPTLEKFERLGLKVYQPPLEDSRTKFYKVTDVLSFLGVEG